MQDLSSSNNFETVVGPIPLREEIKEVVLVSSDQKAIDESLPTVVAKGLGIGVAVSVASLLLVKGFNRLVLR